MQFAHEASEMRSKASGIKAELRLWSQLVAVGAVGGGSSNGEDHNGSCSNSRLNSDDGVDDATGRNAAQIVEFIDLTNTTSGSELPSRDTTNDAEEQQSVDPDNEMTTEEPESEGQSLRYDPEEEPEPYDGMDWESE